MSPHGRPPTRSQSRAKSAAVVPQAPPLTTPEGHVHTFLEGASEVHVLGQPQPLGLVSFSIALPSQEEPHKTGSPISDLDSDLGEAPSPHFRYCINRSNLGASAPAKAPWETPTLPSLPRSCSLSSSNPPSSDSSSSREPSPHRKNKEKVKSKRKETRARPSPFIPEITNTKIPKSLEEPS